MIHFPRKLLTTFSGCALKRNQPLRVFVRLNSSTKNLQDENNQSAPKENGIPTKIVGQPTSFSHPHLVSPGELVPGLPVSEFKSRRSEFMKKLVNSIPKENRGKGHTVVVPSASKSYMSDHIPYIFRQNSDFYYLTGCLEPDSILIMTSLPDSENIYQTVLLLRGCDEHSEIWDGPRTSVDDAPQMFRIDLALPYKELVPFLTKHLSDRNTDNFWYLPGSPLNYDTDRCIKTIINTCKINPPICPRRVLSTLRLLKSPAEARLMLETCKVGSAAINNAMACTKPGTSEHDIHAVIDYYSRRSGAEHLAFPPVVGGGHRATAIHYIHDNQILSNGELLLVDAGCQKFSYNSDITRTWPVNGKFTEAQAVLYDIVLSVQSTLLLILKEQRPTLDRLFDLMCQILGSYLKEEGIISKSVTGSELITTAYKYCPHHVSHYLGLDVHDTPLILRNIPVQPGMVITVEPGIYIRPNDQSVREEFRGIGIRIEDDILITQRDPIVLTEKCLKNRNEIEDIVGSRDLPK
ncbi:xaa-Pro aminopeptidase 3 [Arctopsyche grandis]|uniref:xaa-Pro aminopeptidase 3 n=1 Tax=Arctopsyche grandis TaxID=121162 RepID=UPI00406D9656